MRPCRPCTRVWPRQHSPTTLPSATEPFHVSSPRRLGGRGWCFPACLAVKACTNASCLHRSPRAPHGSRAPALPRAARADDVTTLPSTSAAAEPTPTRIWPRSALLGCAWPAAWPLQAPPPLSLACGSNTGLDKLPAGHPWSLRALRRPGGPESACPKGMPSYGHNSMPSPAPCSPQRRKSFYPILVHRDPLFLTWT